MSNFIKNKPMLRRHTVILLFTFSFATCTSETKNFQKPFLNDTGQYIGDSIFTNGLLSKLCFVNNSYEIDSIVFKRYENSSKSIKSKETFSKGEKVFENIEYYENSIVKRYSFINDENKNFFYERNYDNNGNLLSIKGYPFFKGFIVDSVSQDKNIKKGATIQYRIYHPNPPYCLPQVYIKNDDGSVYNVFKKSKYIPFLNIVYQDNNDTGVYKVNVVLDLKEKDNTQNLNQYQRALIFRVVK